MDPFTGFKRHLIKEKRIDDGVSDYKEHLERYSSSVHTTKTSRPSEKLLFDEPMRFSVQPKSVLGHRKVTSSLDTRNNMKIIKQVEAREFVTDAVADFKIHTSNPSYKRRHAASVMEIDHEEQSLMLCPPILTTKETAASQIDDLEGDYVKKGRYETIDY